jgi:hypothetical protein
MAFKFELHPALIVIGRLSKQQQACCCFESRPMTMQRVIRI